VRRALWLAAAVIVWAAHFLAIYGFTGLACERGFGHAVPWAVGGATLVAAAAVVAILLRGLRGIGDFEHALSAGLAAFALLAILWEGLAVLMVAPCALR
jgi:hypothetical protein